MPFIRGDNLLGLKLSGPQATNVYNQTEELIERLEQFNAWVDEVNAAYQSPILRQSHCRWFGFCRFQRDFMLSYDEDARMWRLDGVIRRQEGEGGPDPDGPPEAPPPGDGGHDIELALNGGFHLPSRGPAARRLPPRRRRRPAGEGAPSGDAPARSVIQVATRVIERWQWRTRAWLRTMERTPRFRHIKSQIEASIAEMEAVARLAHNTALALTVVARRWLRRGAVELRAFLTDFDHAAYQRPAARLESKAIELRQGFTLVLYSFDNPDWESWLFGKFEQPNWECWLFGRRAEDERLSA